MKRNEILQHFPNGCTVECLTKKIKATFDSILLTIRDFKVSGDKTISVWGFHDYHSDSFIILECDKQLAEIIPNDIDYSCAKETELVFIQLGKEVKAILDKESNYAVIGEKVSRLYER